MPTAKSQALKKQVLSRLTQVLGESVPWSARPFVLKFGDSRVFVRVTTKKAGNKFWFDVTPRLYEDQETDFLIYACGVAQDLYVFPVNDFAQFISDASFGGAGDVPNFTIYLDSHEFEPAGHANRKVEIKRFYNAFDLINPRAGLQGEVAGEALAKGRLLEDLEKIQRDTVTPTVKAALVDARIGQGGFRRRVLQLWGNCCAVTQSATLDAIRASHIKPWRASTNDERLDEHDGLPLIASLDALFDAGLISFDLAGKLIASSKLSAAERGIFGIAEKSVAIQPTAKTAEYLAYHRANHFQR